MITIFLHLYVHVPICKMMRFSDFSNFTKGLGYKCMPVYVSTCAYMRIQGLYVSISCTIAYRRMCF